MCTQHGQSGHGLDTMRRRLVAATPRRWVDAIVTESRRDGTLTLLTLDGDPIRAWHHEDLSPALAPGEPVAVHASYGVLAAGGVWRSVAITPPGASVS
jgi:hypothetical protein